MEIIGIICEYNPFHNGHAYHIKKIKELYPDSLIVLVLNGYFLQRGEVSILTKEDKIKASLENDVDIIVEHPFFFATNSSDIFAESAVKILNHLGSQKIVFGSESNDLDLINKIAKVQLEDDFNLKLKEELKKGLSYPKALNNAIGIKLDSPNDLLGISYVKAIIKNNFKIKPITIKRTNEYHDILSNDEIISATNIRNKYKKEINVDKYTKYSHLIKNVNEELLFNLLKFKINTDHNLSEYLTVDEGIENRLIKYINASYNLEDFIAKIKTKRYTHNRIKRMLIHILIGLRKKDKSNIDYIKVLGFNLKGQKYLNSLRETSELLIARKIPENHLVESYELKASLIYDLLTGEKTTEFERSNQPKIKKNIDS